MSIDYVALACFILGLIGHLGAQVDAIARAKNNPANSRIAILKDRWIPIAIRTGACLALFVMWLQGQLADGLTAAGMTLPDWLSRILDMHVGGGFAFFAGLGMDSALGYIPKLKTSLPPSLEELDALKQA